MKNYHVHVRVFPWGDQLRAADGATQQDTAIAFGALNQKLHKTQRGAESHAASCNGQRRYKWNTRRCDCRDNEFTRLKSEVCPRRAGPAFKARSTACLLGRAPIPSHQKIYCARAPGMPTIALMACSPPSRVIWAGRITRIDKRMGSRDSGKGGEAAAIHHRAENPAEAWRHVGLTLPLSSNPSARLDLPHVGQWLCCLGAAEGASLATPFATLECGCGSLGGREATPAP